MSTKPKTQSNISSALSSNGLLRHGQNLSKRKLIVIALILGLVGIYVVYRSLASGAVGSVEGESLSGSGTVISSTTASNGKYLQINSATVTAGTITTTAPATTLSVAASGIQCHGAPQVSIKIDGSQALVASVSNSSGWVNYTANIPISQGTHAISAELKNPLTRGKCSRALNLDVVRALDNSSTDTTPPGVSIANPSNGSTVSGTVNIAASASDNVGVTKVEFYVNNSLSNMVSASPYNLSWDTTLVANGAYSLVAKAYDAAGNVTPSAAVNVTVANNASTLGASLPPPLPESSGSKVSGSTTTALSTLVSGLSAGTTLCLHGGVYGQGQTSSVTLSASGTASNPITIESCTGETAQIAQLIKVTGNYIRLRNLKIIRNNYPTDSRYGQSGTSPGGNVGIWLTGQHVTLEHSEITGATMSGIFGGGAYDQIISNYVHNNGTTPDDHGIYYTSNNSLIANNLFVANYDFGIQLGYTSTYGNVVANNTTVQNGFGNPSYPGSGTVTFSGTSSNLFVNNISAGNAQYGFKTYDTTNTLSHNDAFNNPAGVSSGNYASIAAMLSTNPLFVSTSDFHLQSGSPAIGYGDPAYTPQTDYYGNQRSSADLGAIAH